jgi:hypothetical protein
MKAKICALVIALAGVAAASSAPPVAYPEGYRAWRHVKSMVIEPGHALYDTFGGIHHIYANSLALEGYGRGSFPDGAIIAFDLLAADRGGQAVSEGSRKLIGVMVKDRTRYASTGGWGFEGFKGDSRTERLVGDAASTACFACHESQAGHDYVFSATRD